MFKKSQIAEQWRDSDGYWIALKPGWQVVGDPLCHQVHEDTKRECLMYEAEPCACPNCREAV